MREFIIAVIIIAATLYAGYAIGQEANGLVGSFFTKYF